MYTLYISKQLNKKQYWLDLTGKRAHDLEIQCNSYLIFCWLKDIPKIFTMQYTLYTLHSMYTVMYTLCSYSQPSRTKLSLQNIKLHSKLTVHNKLVDTSSKYPAATLSARPLHHVTSRDITWFGNTRLANTWFINIEISRANHRSVIWRKHTNRIVYLCLITEKTQCCNAPHDKEL